MNLHFICGCRHEIHLDDEKDMAWWKESGFDRQGFLVCPKHGHRRMGWKSLPTAGGKSMWSFSSWTPLECERHVVFGKPLPVRKAAVVFETEDHRDNRDPEKIGIEILAKANGA